MNDSSSVRLKVGFVFIWWIYCPEDVCLLAAGTRHRAPAPGRRRCGGQRRLSAVWSEQEQPGIQWCTGISNPDSGIILAPSRYLTTTGSYKFCVFAWLPARHTAPDCTEKADSVKLPLSRSRPSNPPRQIRCRFRFARFSMLPRSLALPPTSPPARSAPYCVQHRHSIG